MRDHQADYHEAAMFALLQSAVGNKKAPEAGSGIYKAIEDSHVRDAGGQA
jgi:hypothetical protein